MHDPDPRCHLLRRPDVFAWVLYDWANSAYTTLLITVLVAYIQRVVFPVGQWGTVGAVVWAWGISLSMLLGAMVSPVLGAMADSAGTKRFWLGMTALTGASAAIMLGLVPPGHYVVVAALLVFANLMLELSLGIYDGFLPELVKEDEMGAASAWGYGMGYLGGGIALMLAMLMVQFGSAIGISSLEWRLRASLILMGIWWATFTLPALFVLRDRERLSEEKHGIGQVLRSGLADVANSVVGLRAKLSLVLFLISFLFYNDGVQTIISQASTFALQELEMAEADLMAVILMIQFLAFPGALLIAKLADGVGDKPALLGCLATWGGVLVSALWVETVQGFWWLAAVIAVVLGGTQAVSRSIMAAMIPKGENAKYFGFFHLSGKATSFIGTFLFGAVVAATGSSRLAIFGLLPLFLIGAILLGKVRVETPQGTATDRKPVV